MAIVKDELTHEEAVEKATEAAQASEDALTIGFKKPVEYNGEKYTELTFDFESLTGKDGLEIENELAARGKPLVIPAFSGEYLVRMAAKACSAPIGYDFFDIISLRDFNKIRSAARSFLLRSE